MFGPANLSTLRECGVESVQPVVPHDRLDTVRLRIGMSMPVGNEGTGTVIAAGRNVRSPEGRRVGMIGGAMYADYRVIPAVDVIALPAGAAAAAAAGASMFVNPLVALGLVETMRIEGSSRDRPHGRRIEPDAGRAAGEHRPLAGAGNDPACAGCRSYH